MRNVDLDITKHTVKVIIHLHVHVCVHLVTDQTRDHARHNMTNNVIYGYEGSSDLSSPDKLPQEAIYYVYENVASGTPLLNQGDYDYVDSHNHS